MIASASSFLSEKAWQRQVVEMAHHLGWRTYHTFDSRRSSAGFPDLVLVRERVIYAELKAEGGRLTISQREWLTALETAGAEAYVWFPSMFDQIVQVLTSRKGLASVASI